VAGDIPQPVSTSFGIKQGQQNGMSNLDSLLLITEIHDDSRSATKSGAMDFYPPRYRSITGCGNKDRTRGKDNGIHSISCTDSRVSDKGEFVKWDAKTMGSWSQQLEGALALFINWMASIDLSF
jgi:hypothetical protein